ncbi:MAG: DUF362 domain-containing protein [Anaerolineales bacterium]|nr:DUF362 domain-containing protein [Anaerolineales bacterium]
MSTVVIADATLGLGSALEAIFEPHGGIEAVVPRDGGTVYIKPNGVHFAPHTFTDPAVLEAVLAYLRDHGYTRLAVMESSTGGNFTRLVFRVTGYGELCRRYRAEPVYLDEGPTVEVSLRDGTHARIARRLNDDIVHRLDGPLTSGAGTPRAGNRSSATGRSFYLSLPKLKTHSMATVTLGVKNQQAFPVDADRMVHHNHETLHRRLAALYALTRPDFCIIEGLTATAHGHFPATALLDECLVPMDVLVGGQDTLAVDVIGARVLGYALDEVEHLRLCAEWGLGEGDIERVDVRGRPLSDFTARLPHTLLRRFHPKVRWVVGRAKACVEGCRGNSECIQEMLYNDYHGEGGWTLVCGAGFQDGDLDGLPGDILVVGPCACDEVGEPLRRRYADRKIFLVPEHNDLMTNTRYQASLMGLTPVNMVPLHPLYSAWTLFQAKLRGLKARVPPLLG